MLTLKSLLMKTSYVPLVTTWNGYQENIWEKNPKANEYIEIKLYLLVITFMEMTSHY
jgi:hypothetical protein